MHTHTHIHSYKHIIYTWWVVCGVVNVGDGCVVWLVVLCKCFCVVCMSVWFMLCVECVVYCVCVCVVYGMCVWYVCMVWFMVCVWCVCVVYARSMMKLQYQFQARIQTKVAARNFKHDNHHTMVHNNYVYIKFIDLAFFRVYKPSLRNLNLT